MGKEGGLGSPGSLHTCPLFPQLLWPADADRKQQCSFKGKDPKVSQLWGSRADRAGGTELAAEAGGRAGTARAGGEGTASETAATAGLEF